VIIEIRWGECKWVKDVLGIVGIDFLDAKVLHKFVKDVWVTGLLVAPDLVVQALALTLQLQELHYLCLQVICHWFGWLWWQVSVSINHLTP